MKIVALCTVAAVIYGVVHDQVTARICVEYFTVFHPPVFQTHSPTLLALGWGVIATWWAGAIIGCLIAIAARFGIRNQLGTRDLLPMVAILMGYMAVAAIAAGVFGYLKAAVPPEVAEVLGPDRQRRLMADWWAHLASYASGFLGGLVVCAVIAVKRLRAQGARST